MSTVLILDIPLYNVIECCFLCIQLYIILLNLPILYLLDIFLLYLYPLLHFPALYFTLFHCDLLDTMKSGLWFCSCMWLATKTRFFCCLCSWTILLIHHRILVYNSLPSAFRIHDALVILPLILVKWNVMTHCFFCWGHLNLLGYLQTFFPCA